MKFGENSLSIIRFFTQIVDFDQDFVRKPMLVTLNHNLSDDQQSRKKMKFRSRFNDSIIWYSIAPQSKFVPNHPHLRYLFLFFSNILCNVIHIWWDTSLKSWQKKPFEWLHAEQNLNRTRPVTRTKIKNSGNGVV
jgi:hypothetical protein